MPVSGKIGEAPTHWRASSFQRLAEGRQTAHLVQFFDSTTARVHVSDAGAKGGSFAGRSAVRAAVSRPKSAARPTSTATLSTST
jgi:hypothetical protein